MLPAVLCGAGELGSKEAFCKRAERRSAGLFSLAGISVMITRLRVPHPDFHLSVVSSPPGSGLGAPPEVTRTPATGRSALCAQVPGSPAASWPSRWGCSSQPEVEVALHCDGPQTRVLLQRERLSDEF